MARTYYSASIAAATTVSGTAFVDKVSLAIPSPVVNSTVLWMWSSEANNQTNNTANANVILVQDPGAATSANQNIELFEMNSTTQFYSAFGIAIWKPGASPVSTNFKIQCAAETATNSTVHRNARLIGLVLSGNDYVTAVDGSTASISATYATLLSLTTTTPSATWLAIGFSESRSAAATSAVQFYLDIDGVTYWGGGLGFESKDADNQRPAIATQIVPLTNAAHTIKLLGRGGGANSTFRNARLAMLDMAGFTNSYYFQTATTVSISAGTFEERISVSANTQAVNHLIFANMRATPGPAGSNSVASNFLEDSTTLGGNYGFNQPTNEVSTGLMPVVCFVKRPGGNHSWHWQVKIEPTFVGITLNMGIAVLQLDDAPVSSPKGPRLGNNPLPRVGVGRSDFTYPIG